MPDVILPLWVLRTIISIILMPNNMSTFLNNPRFLTNKFILQKGTENKFCSIFRIHKIYLRHHRLKPAAKMVVRHKLLSYYIANLKSNT